MIHLQHYHKLAMNIVDSLTEKFISLYDSQPLVIKSPGRVNLIGEHTDYNQGLVLPAAINKYIYIGIAKNNLGKIRLHSLDLEDSFETENNAIKRSGKLWPDYILGVVEQLQLNQYTFSGFDLAFIGEIPQGAGLSSSAALECATTHGISRLFHLNIQKLDIALLSQAAENQFVGVNCGLMDQFASVFGKSGNLIKLDCSDYSYEYIPFNASNIKLLLLDSQVKHSLASSAYNERREQCEQGVALVAKHRSGISSLRDITEKELQDYVLPVDPLVYKRCSYVIAEINRVRDACAALKEDDFITFGKKMYQSHEGLTRSYEVSCKELDLLVELVKNEPAVYGARMMGGGFGGCTINLVEADQVDRVGSDVANAYEKKTGIQPNIYVAEISSGTSVINQIDINVK